MMMKRHSITLVAYLGTLLMLPVSILSVSHASIAVAQTATQQLSQQELQKLTQAITVRVFTKNKTSGSGVIISKRGQVYTVLTNAHVLTSGEPYRITTPDGKSYAAVIPTQKLTYPAGTDVAILQFRAATAYQLAILGVSSPVAVNQQVVAAGFPFDSREIAFTTGRVSLLPDKALKGGYRIGYSNDIRQGMSGGPILNYQGEVIGINGLHANVFRSSRYVYTDGSQPSASERLSMQNSSWGVALQTVAPLIAQFVGTCRECDAIASEGNVDSRPLPPAMQQVDEIARQITVLIKMSNGDNGSGVIIAHKGDTYYVLTSAHNFPKNQDLSYQIVTPDREKYPVKLEQAKIFPGVDLALVQFSSPKTYQVATLAKYNFKNRQSVFSSGWPAASQGSQVKPSRRFAAGLIFDKQSSYFFAKDSNSFTQGYELVYTNNTAGGMSGGPVLDSRGRVIGIHGRAEAEINQKSYDKIQIGLSLGIPISTFLSLVERVGIESELKVENSVPPD
ncbi:MAG TPA: serine protease, partial [Candidatus Obscuribacterales bacterium]